MNGLLKFGSVCAILILITWGSAFAGDMDVSVRGGYFYYGEPDAGISYSGVVSGVRGAYESSFSGVLIRIRTELMSGNLKYDGSLNTHIVEGATATAAPPSQTHSVSYASSLWYSDSAFLMGSSFLKNGFEIRPFIGLGFRYLENPENKEVPFDYERNTTSIYLPMVLEFHKKISEKQAWGFSGEIDLLLNGSTRAKLSDASEKFNDLDFDQALGAGARIAGFYHCRWMGVDLSVKPFVDLWMVKESDTDELEYEGSRILVKSADGSFGDYREPANITLAGGLELALYF
ncbi:MAG: hypothetical protein KKF30_18625 [Proteobacteria bacterium]|nr:hypothetical protein [Pseudomonadota bacterium]MBU4470904.1 hypothetical protein [Pseudomonadota bacterium]MCG2751902.1 hypothetical protein [Desulfobacteraceae bacterium]